MCFARNCRAIPVAWCLIYLYRQPLSLTWQVHFEGSTLFPFISFNTFTVESKQLQPFSNACPERRSPSVDGPGELFTRLMIWLVTKAVNEQNTLICIQLMYTKMLPILHDTYHRSGTNIGQTVCTHVRRLHKKVTALCLLLYISHMELKCCCLLAHIPGVLKHFEPQTTFTWVTAFNVFLVARASFDSLCSQGPRTLTWGPRACMNKQTMPFVQMLQTCIISTQCTVGLLVWLLIFTTHIALNDGLWWPSAIQCMQIVTCQ